MSPCPGCPMNGGCAQYRPASLPGTVWPGSLRKASGKEPTLGEQTPLKCLSFI